MNIETYFLVTLRRNDDYNPGSKEKEEERQLAHQTFLSDLNKEGLLLSAGPFDGGGGIAFFDPKVISEDELELRLKEDPHAAAESHIFEIKTWYVPKHTIIFTTKEYHKIHFPVS
ncbi:MAG: YciI family protein [Candidatus Kariarchaeaceae archaeon]|jgi:uncharacterized protein YciI